MRRALSSLLASRARLRAGMWLVAIAPLVVGSVVACSSQTTGAIQLTTGGESDTFSRAPAPSTLVVEGIDPDGGTTELARTALPTDNVDLGTRDQSSLYTVRVRGIDNGGATLVAGTSLPVELGALAGSTLPIFVQRTGELARMPGPLGDAREQPIVTLVIGQYLLVAGGSSSTQLYDLGSLAPFTAPPTLPRTPKSILPYGTKMLLVDDAGATWFELADSTQTDAPAPSGGSYAEVAGGQAVVASDGSAYLVGATRKDGAPTARVLRVALDGSLAFANLTEPRLGAGATWVAGRGLVVAGGSADGAGIEVLPAGATAAVPLPSAADPTLGAGLVALDAGHVLLAGGSTPTAASAPTRVADLGCSATCQPTTWPDLPVALGACQAFAFDATHALVTGDDAAGASHAVLLRPDAAQELPFKLPHRGTRGTKLASGAVVFAGGSATLEQFTP